MLRRLCFILSIALLCGGGVVRAADDESQPQPREPVRIPGNVLDEQQLQLERAAELDSESARTLQVARQMMAQGNFDGASAMLETVYEKHPTHPVVYRMLKDCYENLKYATKELMLTGRMESANPNNYIYSLEHASALSRHHQPDSALAAYHRALGRIAEFNMSGFRQTIDEMTNHGFEDEADSIILAMRVSRADSTLFAIERGTIFEIQRAYDSAAAEFVSILGDSSNSAAIAERKLQSMLTFEESEELVANRLKVVVANDPTERALKLLIDHYLRTDDQEAAFELAVTRDSLTDDGGGMLAYIVRAAAEREMYPQVKRMAVYVLSHYPQSPALNEVRFYYGDALAELGEYDAAIADYDTVYATSPLLQDKAEALYRLAKLYRTKINDCNRAEEYYDSLITKHRSGIAYFRGLVERPYCQLRNGNLSQARSMLTEALNRSLSEDFKEELQFNLARLDFFEKKFDSAKTAFRKIIVDYPRGFFVNDALYYLRVIEDAEGDESLLYDYANARLFRERDMFDSTVNTYEQLIEAENKALADLALYELVDVELAARDTLNALADINRFGEQHPDSYYYPYVLKLKADILFGDPARILEAGDIYRQLLKEHPNYPFSGEVRKRLRQANSA